MSTLADLFNNRISLNRRVILAERFVDKYLIYIIPLKGEEPLKVEIFNVDIDNFSNTILEHGVTREDLYIILHPNLYCKNSIQLPFKDPQKIEAIIDNEVIDYLPYESVNNETDVEISCIVDFDIFYKRVIAYSIDVDLISKIIDEIGEYSNNLKAVIPYGAILRDFFASRILSKSETKIIMIECSDKKVEVWGFSKDINGEIVLSEGSNVNDINSDKIISAILGIKKYYKDDRYTIFSKIAENKSVSPSIFSQLKEIENKLSLRYFNVNFEEYADNYPGYKIDDDFKITLYSFLEYLQKKDRRVNLLKGHFKPSIKNYIKVKDFVLLGIIVLILAGFSFGKFFTDISFLSHRVKQLKDGISVLTEKTFGKKLTSIKSAVGLLNSVKNECKVLEKNINRKYSALELFKEFTASLPVDVDLEYTDILIDQNRIRFNGKTKSFSDIDKIKESLQNSEYFTEVNVTNSGTTGSTGGFIVNFQFDIKCSIE